MNKNKNLKIESLERMILMSASGIEIEGTDAVDYLAGTDGDDVINSGAGNDEIFHTAGNDVVDGGSGFDTFYVYSGTLADYNISKDAGGVVTVKGAGGDTNVLTDVERIVIGNDAIDTADLSVDGGDPTGGDNSAPEAHKDYYTTPKDETIWGNVLDNDSDPDGDDLQVTLIEGPDSGSLLLNEDGSFDYIPEQGFTGKITFTYEASDGHGGTDTAEVCITVEGDDSTGPSDNPTDPGDNPTHPGDDPDDDDEPSDNSGSNKSGKSGSEKSGSNKSGKNGSNKSGSNKSGSDKSGKSGSNKSGSNKSGKSGSNKSGSGNSGNSGSGNSGNSGSDSHGEPTDPDPSDPGDNKDIMNSGQGESVWINTLEHAGGLNGHVRADITAWPVNGYLEGNSDGTLNYVPYYGFVGDDTFEYTVVDSYGNTVTRVVCVHVG